MPAKDWSPDRFATTDIDQLPALFAAPGCRLRTALAHRIVAFASGTLPPHPTATAGAQPLTPRMMTNGLTRGLRSPHERATLSRRDA